MQENKNAKQRQGAGNQKSHNTSTEGDPESRLEPRLSKATALLAQGLAIALPLFYATGRIYSSGYWGELGLSASLMDRSTPDFVYFGFVAIANALAHYVGLDPYSMMGVIFAIAGLVGALLLLAWAIERWLLPWLRRRAQALDVGALRALARHEISDRIFAAFVLALEIAFGLLALLLCCLFLFLFVALATHEGIRQATDLRKAFIKTPAQVKSSQSPAVWVFIDESSTPIGRLVECSSRWCVVFQDGRFSAVPASTVTSIEQRKRDH